MRVNVEVQPDPLLKQLAAQFEAMQKKLQGMKAEPAHDMAPMMKMMAKQQDALLRAMERMMARPSSASPKSDDAMLQALRGLKQVIRELPDDLKGALNGSYKRTQDTMTHPRVTVKPEITVNLSGLNKRLDRMEESLVIAAKRSRNRTFGSNY